MMEERKFEAGDFITFKITIQKKSTDGIIFFRVKIGGWSSDWLPDYDLINALYTMSQFTDNLRQTIIQKIQDMTGG